MSIDDRGIEGYPNYADLYTEGSQWNQIRSDAVQTPQGLALTSAQSARISKYQNQAQTAIVGVPGSTYTPHESDLFLRGPGGSTVVLGNAPGAETARIQTPSGAIVECSNDGSLKFSSASGAHFGVSGEGHFVFQGDINFVTTGAFKIKCGSYHIESGDHHSIVQGTKTQDVGGDFSSRITGDHHATVQGDSSKTIGGSHRETIAGSHTSQVTGSRIAHTKGPVEMSGADTFKVESKNKMTHTSEADMEQGTKGNHSVVAEGNSSHDVKGSDGHTMRATNGIQHHAGSTYQVVSKGDMSHHSSEGGMTQVAQGNISHSSNGGSISQTASQNHSVDAGQNQTITAGGSHTTQAASGITHSGATSYSSFAAAQSTTYPSSPMASLSIPNPAAAATPNKPKAATGQVEKTNTKVPDEKTIHKLIGDAVDTYYTWADVLNEQTVYNAYHEGEGDEPPQGVKEAMKKKGMEYDQYVKNNTDVDSQGASTDNAQYDVETNSSFSMFG